MNLNRKKEVNTYEAITAGSLLKFEKIDNIDFSLLVEDFKKTTSIEVEGLWCYPFHNNIGKYIKTLKNGTIQLRDGMSLDYFIEEENRTLRKKLQEVAGSVVNNYFKNFDVEKYKKDKEKALSENKTNVLNTANVLLISDIQKDYDEIIKYGFKNVDYFKSIIRADKYFAEHPKELQKYHIILRGNQNVQHCCLDGAVELDRTIRELSNRTHILETSLCIYDTLNKIVTYLGDNNNHRDWVTEEQTYTDIFDRIVENTLINHTLEKVKLKNKKFEQITDYINPNRLPLPTKKSDLRVLYLDTIRVNEFADGISRELGLNITFKEDDNRGLGRYIKSHLGDYDIIIVSRIYSDNLLGMNGESTEQCKDTGRNLTLLVSYDEDYWGVDHDLGNAIQLKYVYGGICAPSSKLYAKKFRALRQLIEVNAQNEDLKKHAQSEYSNMKAIVEASVNFYNEALVQANKSTLNDLDLKSAEEFENEYVTVLEKKEQEIEAELAPIRSFDSIRYAVTSYLDHKNKGLIDKIPEGLKITEGNDGVQVENIYQGRTLCSIIFPKEYKQENLRIFGIQTLSKKGTLSNLQTIGLYTSKYENLENIPTRPDEKQANALVSIEKKINVALKPLNNEAWNRILKLDKQQRLVLNRKNKKRKRN